MRLALLLCLLLTACAAPYYGDADTMLATAQSLQAGATLANSAERQQLQAATVTADAMQSDWQRRVQETQFALSADQTRQAGTATADVLRATQTEAQQRADQDWYVSSIERNATEKTARNLSTLGVEELQATRTAIAVQRTQDERWTAYITWLPWILTCGVLAPVFATMGIYLYRWKKRTDVEVEKERARSLVWETSRGQVIYINANNAVLLDDWSRTQRLKALPPLTSPSPLPSPNTIERIEHEHKLPERPQHPTAVVLTKAVDVVGWNDNRIPGHRELEMSGDAWDKGISPLRDAGMVNTGNDGTFVAAGTIADLWHDVFRRGKITL